MVEVGAHRTRNGAELTRAAFAAAGIPRAVFGALRFATGCHRLRPLGSTFVAAGRHLVAVSYPWLFMRECGRNKATVDVQAGESMRVSYRPWFVRFVPGRIRIESAEPGEASA
jgi:hypothetical protein